MKYNDTIDILKIFANAVFDPSSVTSNARKSTILKYSKNLESNNNNVKSENSNQQNNESVPTLSLIHI